MYPNQITQRKITLNRVKARTFNAIILHTLRIAGFYTTTKNMPNTLIVMDMQNGLPFIIFMELKVAINFVFICIT